LRFQYYLKCVECEKEFSPEDVRYVCPECSKEQRPFEPIRGVLEIVINIPDLKKESFDIGNFLPFNLKSLINYPVGNTPLIYSKNLSNMFGFKHLYIKNDSKNPTNSLKDRASILVVADAIIRDEKVIATASTGNAASSLAGVCAYTGMKAIIFVPASAPIGKLVQMLKYGATVVRIDGTYDMAFELCREYCEITQACNRNTSYNPMTTEGKKTVSLEIFRDLDFRIPDIIFVPVGDGSIISGVIKGLKDLMQFGYIKKLPMVIGVQAEGSDSVYQGFNSGVPVILDKTNTIADSISVSAPRNGIRAIKDIKETNGFCVRVSDEEILEAQSILGKTSGIFSEPAASSSLAGFIKIKDKLDKDSSIVILSTGDGLKDIESAKKNIEIETPIKPNIDEVISFLNSKKDIHK